VKYHHHALATRRRFTHAAPTALLLLVTVACAPTQESPTAATDFPVPADAVRIPEAWHTAYSPEENIDSVVVWPTENWVIATGKATHRLLVYDATDGRLITTVGEAGDGDGSFRRPNGIALVDDLLFVVERDNARVQVLHLPEFETAATVGVGVLRRPYGLTVFPGSDGTVELYVSDNYESEASSQAPPDFYTERIKHFRVGRDSDEFIVEFVRSFGDPEGPGRLSKVESLAADPATFRLLIADEDEQNLKLYTLGGSFTGTVLGHDLFSGEPEGIALLTCGESGFWIVTDQHDSASYFHILDRASFRTLGTFYSEATRNTDGIAVQAGPAGVFPRGVFVAVDDDRAVTAFSLNQVAKALDMPMSCPEG